MNSALVIITPPPQTKRAKKLLRKKYGDRPRCIYAYPHFEARVEVNPISNVARNLPIYAGVGVN